MPGPGVLFEACYFFFACWLLAQIEIQIEGPNGWAAKLPTWRYEPAWLMKLTNGKPVTGYHVYLTVFLVTLFHLPLLFVPWSRAVEAKVLSLYFLMTVFWDFQWFVWNPVWGARRYFKETVWWFPRRLAGFPLEYYLGVASSFAVTALLAPEGLRRWAVLVVLLLAASAASVAAAEFLRREG